MQIHGRTTPLKSISIADLIAQTSVNMSGIDAKVILLFTLLGTSLAFRTPSEVEARISLADLKEMENDESELSLQEDKAELMLMYAKIAEEHAEVFNYR